MSVVYSLLQGAPADLLEARYISDKIPFSGTAEMIATLAAIYHDNNQASKAREELNKMMYDPADKKIDIHQFIGKINSLADKANIPEDDRKSTLQEHVPASLSPDLLTKSKDPSISYEIYCSIVGDVALNQQRAYRERQAKRDQTKAESSSRQAPRRRSHEQEYHPDKRYSTSTNQSQQGKEKLKDAGL